MSNFWKSTRRWLPGVIISLVAIVIILKLVGIDRLVQALRAADYRFVLLALGTSWLWMAVRGIVWRTLLQKKATYKQVFFTLCEGYMINNLLPLKLGELGRAFLLGRKAELPFMEVLSTIVIERVLDVAFAAAVLLMAVPFLVGTGNASRIALVVAGLVVVGLVVLYLLARNPDWALGWFDRLSSRWPRLQRQGSQFLAPLFSGLAILTKGWLFVRVLLWMTLNWFCAVVQFYITVLAFFPHAPVTWAMFTLGAAAAGGAIPSAPGSLGTLDAVMVGALTLISHNAGAALAITVITRFFNYILSGLLGAYALSTEGETLMGVYRQLRRRQEEQPAELS
jgi:uncharacterized protein (TIRG00374 family)